MKTIAIGIFVFFAGMGLAVGATNLLQDPGFEEQGSWGERAAHWEWGYPDAHGSNFGTASRRDWRRVNGTYESAICGTWAGTNFGGCWQEVPATPGTTYRFTSLFWADDQSGNNWTSACQGVQISFYTSTNSLLYSVS
ncbi:MAG: hypothetical protein V2A34_10545, partial [Lentisphaerota bacterium]